MNSLKKPRNDQVAWIGWRKRRAARALDIPSSMVATYLKSDIKLLGKNAGSGYFNVRDKARLIDTTQELINATPNYRVTRPTPFSETNWRRPRKNVREISRLDYCLLSVLALLIIWEIFKDLN